MEFYPYQMTQTTAARYCGVSVTEFKKNYRPHIRERAKGGFIYFLKTDLEKHINELFNQKPAKCNQATRHAKPKPSSKTDFDTALEKLKA